MVPWTPFNHWEGPPIASLQRETLGKGGSPAVLSRSPQRHPSLPASRQRIYSKIIALTPLAILMAFSTPKQTRENYRSRFWAMEINHLLHENFGQWYDFPSGYEPNTLPGFLWSSAFVWKINWSSTSPPFVTSFWNGSAEAVVTRHFAWESRPKLSKTTEIRKTLTVFSNSTEIPEHSILGVWTSVIFYC